MSARALILAYHGIEAGPPPLWIEPVLFARQLDVIAESGCEVVPLGRIAAGLRDGDLPDRAVAITFDDGLRSVVDNALPLLRERELPATLFCVAGWLGRTNDWPSQPPDVPRRPLASAEELAAAAAAGFDVGSHGIEHAPLDGAGPELVERELVESRALLEDAVGAPVRHFAHPYGAPASAHARELVERTYAAACGGDNEAVRPGTDPYELPRVEMHYLRRPALLRRLLAGDDRYLALRRLGGRARRLARRDWR